MGYHVVDGPDLQWEDRDPVAEGLPMRYSANVSKLAGLTQSYGRWWNLYVVNLCIQGVPSQTPEIGCSR